MLRCFEIIAVILMNVSSPFAVWANEHKEAQVVENGTGPILLVTHPSRAWDLTAKAKPGINAIIEQFRRGGLPYYVLTDTLNPEARQRDYYIENFNSLNWYYSRSGRHFISFPHSNKFVIVGGNFDRCFCSTLWNTIQNSSSDIEITIPGSATYNEMRRTIAKRLTPDALFRLIGMTWEEVDRTANPDEASLPAILISDLIHELGFQGFIDLLEHGFFQENCGDGGDDAPRYFAGIDLTYGINGKEWIRSNGHGRRVKLIFTE